MSLLSRLAVSAARAYGALSSNPNAVSASYLVVAGGGAGARRDGAGGGGGGAGGFRTGTSTLSILNTYSITVGAGGATAGDTAYGGSGANSVLSGTGLTTITSTGGGGGGAIQPNSAGLSGGSGGGGTHTTGAGGAGNTPSTTPSQGNNGGASDGPGGGGGGAGAVGSNSSNPNGGNGGNGSSSSISGSSVTYAGGGGGGSNGATGGTGGTGGGGAGSSSGTAGVAGTANRGGGGGGSGYLGISPYTGAGGSGVVIISYTSATPKFIGGTLTTSGGNQIHTFTSSGSLSPLTPVTASYLVVAGGGSGGIGYAGGGGAGGLLTGSTTLYSGATYVVTVGAGGTATGTNVAGGVGGNSVLSGTGLTTLTSTGGGGGAGFVLGQVATAGGSGGGGMYSSLGGYGNPTGGAGTSGQGYAGGTPAGTGGYFGGGGGGSSAVGANGSGSSNATSTGGAGGAGTASSISGSSVTYAGGGGGGAYLSGAAAGVGGSGGGGAGSKTTSTTGGSGTTNTGGGGGGACDGVTTAGSGGSGTVIISYAGSQVFNGGLVTSSGGNTIHTFNATGALTPVTNNLNNSLRFRQSANGYLSRTPSSATNRRTWTWSGWVKLGTLGTDRVLFSAGSGATDSLIYIASGNQLYVNTNNSTNVITNALLRDPSAWYHIVVAFDTTQATAANRVKVYINGNQQTFTGGGTLPTQNTDGGINNNIQHLVGGYAASPSVISYDGYMTDINFIDGQALEPYYFGNNDAYGNWKPIKYTGMYGTNGFYLTFADTSALTTSTNAGLGKDTSGNGNFFATNNISITAGVTYDAMLDVPTNTSATVANYCVLNPLNVQGVMALTNASLTTTITATASFCGTRGTMAIPSTGKWYWETKATTLSGSSWVAAGMATIDPVLTTFAGGVTNVIYWANHQVTPANSIITNETTTVNQSATVALAAGDIVQCAYDADTGKFWFGKNNVYWDSSVGTTGNPSAGTNQTLTAATKTWFPMVQIFGNTTTAASQDINFGQRPFSYSAPSGFVALNTYNLPTPTILKGNLYMDATLYTGNGSSQNVINAALFQPDLVWMKSRSNTYDNALYDSLRTAMLVSNSSAAEVASSNVVAYNSNGFLVGTGDTRINASAATYVGWQWQAGQGTTTAGTGTGGITSVTQSVSTTSGFSVVTYTGSGTNGTVTHGLGVAPKWVIIKQRSAVRSWNVWHSALSGTQFLLLEDTAAVATDATKWNSTIPTSSVISLGTAAGTNTSAGTYVAYCWAEIAGFSKFGSYTGNGSADGSFVYTGFRPKFIMVKASSSGGTNYDWYILDSSRDTYNVATNFLCADLSQAEATGVNADFLSNGFKLRGTTVGTNQSGVTYIFMAFAENPFNNSNAR